ncbi:MAG TPA: 2-oxo-3-hexenedioate decarboxylase [Ilumatobacteraceae bacterium]|nr:2-oxo-3-hexenedioate decarboxylase [Ilumatobacteraceae bacterium]
MALSAAVIADLADVVDNAQRDAAEIVKLTDAQPAMDVADGYAVQTELCRRWQAAGRRLTGYKGGLTSKAKMVQMGLDTPVFGVLMGDTCVPDGGVVDMTQLIHPRVEAEIAFVTSTELSGDVSIDEVLAATEFVLPAIEVIDSRFKDFKFDVQSVIADNTSAARYVVGGSPRRPDGLDLRLLGVVMEQNGELVGTAAGAAVMGHPAASVVALVKWLADSGQALPAGSLVMTGGVTEAVAVHAGDHVTARVQHLGTVGVRFA